MAVVYKAFDTHLEIEVAVKVIRIDNLPRNTEERALKRFEREAKAVARLNHPNIVKVTDYGDADGRPYLVMPLLSGGTLKQLIRQRGQIPWQEAVEIIIPIADSLEYAHSQGVIHRDIKPSNILLTSSGQPMLSDFGVAKIVEDEVTQDLTGTSATVGTPEYMAPEQITSKTVDGRADLYSLGVVLFEMITGRRPFEADTPMAVIIKQASDPLPRPSQFVKDLPKGIELFLIKTLTKKPENRYQSADEMKKTLVTISSGSLAAIIQLNPPPISAKIKPLLKISLPSLAALVILGLVAILISHQRSTSNNETPVLVASPSITSEVNPTITSTPPLIPTFSKTNTPEPKFSPMLKPTQNGTFLYINPGNSVNCRNVPDKIGFVIKIYDSNDTLLVNGIDSTNEWINISTDPVTNGLGEEISDCWINKNNNVKLTNESTLPIIDSRPIYEVWKLSAAAPI